MTDRPTDADKLRFKRLLHNAGYLKFKDVCDELGIDFLTARVAMFRGSSKGKAGRARDKIMAHLESKQEDAS